MQVSDGALRCFASLADRFTRRGVDPAPLAEHGLSGELLERLASAAASAGEKTCSSGATPDSKSNSTSVSTIVSLLSTLCRGSPSVTHVCFVQLNLLSYNIPFHCIFFALTFDMGDLVGIHEFYWKDLNNH